MSLDVAAQCQREPLGPTLTPVVHVSDVASLLAAVRQGNKTGNLTIALAEGEYALKRPLGLSNRNITLRGLTGERERVVLRGDGMSGDVSHIFQITGSDITIADLTAGWVRYHVAQIHAESDADRIRLHNVRFVDAAEQIIKMSHRRGGPQSDETLIEWSVFEFTSGHAHQSYTGGIGAIGARDLTIRNNVFRNIRVPPGVRGSATAIMVRRDSAGTRIEKNVIVNSDTGIRLGLSDGAHGPGYVINNIVHAVGDVGISLEHASGVVVAHNTVWSDTYPNAIEYRFPDSLNNRIEANLLRGAIRKRDGAVAVVEGNVEFAQADWFLAPALGNLTLAKGHPALVDRAEPLPYVADDVHCRPRPAGRYPDVGAEEYSGLASDDDGLLGMMLERFTGLIDIWWGSVAYSAARLPGPLWPIFSVGFLLGLWVGGVWIWQARRDARKSERTTSRAPVRC